MIFIAVFAPLLSPYDPAAISPTEAFLKPGVDGHIFGTDNVGRDLLTRVFYGAGSPCWWPSAARWWPASSACCWA